jgi:GTP-binding protein
MSFVDKVEVFVKAGNGGNGKLSFRHEKYIAKGGPDGGDGGNGGSVVFVASFNQNTLTAFRYQMELKADNGQSGEKRRKHGRTGKNLIVKVPVGTVASDKKGKVLADLVSDGQEAILAAGGKGGFGNAHFVSSRRQAPNFAEKGELGDEKQLILELKMIADVGLIGLPNAGKSTLLSKVSNARPEIANYPFTTLSPNLGVVDVDKSQSILFADIPGLIEGAAEGKGLGHDFLRHVERTAAILHLIDAYNDDVVGSYQTVRNELKAYQNQLVRRPEIIALTKTEGLDQEIIDDLVSQLRRVTLKKTPIVAISSQSGAGLKQLLFDAAKIVQDVRTKPTKVTKKNSLPVFKLDDVSGQWKVVKSKGVFKVSGERVERFAQRTNFENEEGVQRLRDILRRAGIMHELIRKGIKAGQVVQVGVDEHNKFEY